MATTKTTALALKPNPTLRDFQAYVARMVRERGFDKETIPQKFMLLLEECGELAKAARKSQGIKTGTDAKHLDIAHEAADVFINLVDLCNALGVDLEQAFREKEAMNKQRVWQ